MCTELLSGLKWIGYTVFGGLITYLYTRHHNKVKDEKEARNKLNATCYSVCFYLAMQQSELGGLLKDIEHRIKHLNILQTTIAASRDQIVTVSQDFVFCKDLSINIAKISEIILPYVQDHRGIIEILQCVFISNKKYFKVLSTLERFNEAKRLITKEYDANSIQDLLQFAKINLPQYEEEIKHNMAFISKSLDGFKAEVKTKFNIIINLSIEKFVKVN